MKIFNLIDRSRFNKSDGDKKTQTSKVNVTNVDNIGKIVEGRYFKKIKILLFTDSRGIDIIKDLSYDFYTNKLAKKYDVEMIVNSKKWTTTLDFIELYDAMPNKKEFDVIILHTGIVDFSPRPYSVAKKIYQQKKKIFDLVFSKEVNQKYFSKAVYKQRYEKEKTHSLYSLEMANDYLLPRLKAIPNLIWINCNEHILENRGNYFKKRPKNINLISKYNKLFTNNILNVVRLDEWSKKEVSIKTYDGIHLKKEGSDYVYEKIEEVMMQFLNCTGATIIGNMIGKSVDLIQSQNSLIKKEEVKTKPLFILASGPSLGMIDVSVLKNCYTMTFNRSYIAFKDWGFEPTYFVGVDTVVNNDNKKQYRETAKRGRVKRFFFTRDSMYEKYLRSELVDFIDIEDDPHNPSIDFNTFLKVGNSGLFGLQIAIGILGFREIYLIGCDANYSDEVEGVDIVNGKYISKENKDTNHFRQDYYGKGTVYNKPGNMKWHYPAWKAFFDKYIYSKYLGVKIYNLSPISKLTFFEKANFEDIFKNIKMFEK